MTAAYLVYLWGMVLSTATSKLILQQQHKQSVQYLWVWIGIPVYCSFLGKSPKEQKCFLFSLCDFLVRCEFLNYRRLAVKTVQIALQLHIHFILLYGETSADQLQHV